MMLWVPMVRRRWKTHKENQRGISRAKRGLFPESLKRNSGEKRSLGFPRRATPQTPPLASDDKRGGGVYFDKKMQASIRTGIRHASPVQNRYEGCRNQARPDATT